MLCAFGRRVSCGVSAPINASSLAIELMTASKTSEHATSREIYTVTHLSIKNPEKSSRVPCGPAPFSPNLNTKATLLNMLFIHF